MIQIMPDAEESTIDYIEKKVAGMQSITNMLSEGKTLEEILQMVLGDLELKIGEKSQCLYKCNCSRDRMERNIYSLGIKELEDILSEQGEAEAQCHFCNKTYIFDKDDLKEMINSLKE